MKGRSLYILIITIILCLSCRNTSKFIFSEADPDSFDESVNLSPEAIAEISKNISFPVEIANLLQIMGIPFSPEYLASSINPDNESPSSIKALHLGILGADLGYINMYEKTGSSPQIISNIRKLAKGIRADQLFDFKAINRLSSDKSNPDSLLFLSIDPYSKTASFLNENGNGQLSSLLIIGVWIEGQFLATQVAKGFADPLLTDRIGEQKVILNDLILLAKPYCNADDDLKTICQHLHDLRNSYRNVNISYTLGEPIAMEIDGGLTVKQTETSVVTMTEEQLAGIIEVTKSIRENLILIN